MTLPYYDIDAVARALKQAKRSVVLSHYNPDADAYGSSCGLALAMRAQGKEVVIVNETGILEGLSFIPGVKDVKATLPSGDFDLLIACDCGDEKRLGESFTQELRRFKAIANIDHHRSNPGFGTFTLVDPLASSTSELIFRLLKKLAWPITPEIATCLFAGLSADTGSFCFGSTSQQCFEIAAELVSLGANSTEISNSLYRNISLSSIKLFAAAVDKLELLSRNRIAIATITDEMFKRFNANYDDAERFSERVSDIRGIVIGCSIRDQGGVWHVSLRSKSSRVDVGTIASQFGGGGHKAAAAFRCKKALDEFKPRLLQTLERTLDEQR